MTAELILWAVLLLFAYLFGSIPTAYIVVLWRKGKDIRSLGDGNSGAANVARVLGAPSGLAVGAFDIAKGILVAALAGWLAGAGLAMAAGLLAIIGHNWPVYLWGRGGRGAATGIGVLLATAPAIALPLVPLGLLLLYLTKSSTKVIAGFFILLPFLSIWPGNYAYATVAYTLVVPLFVGASHLVSVRMSRIEESS